MSLSFAISVLVVLVLYGLFGLLNRRFTREAASGRMVEGTITATESAVDEKGKQFFFIRYQFTDPRGARQEGEQRFSRRDDWAYYKVGQTVRLVNNPLLTRGGLMTQDSFNSQRATLRKTMLFYPFAAAAALFLSYSGAK